MRMFDTVAAKFEKGPYLPRDASRNAWETCKRERFDSKLDARVESVVHILSLAEVRIMIMGDGGLCCLNRRFQSYCTGII
jgi:hypothetical protein